MATVVFAALAAGLWMKDARDLEQIHNLEGQLAEVQTRSQEIARAAEETDKISGHAGDGAGGAEADAGNAAGTRGRAVQRGDGDGDVRGLAAGSACEEELPAVAGAGEGESCEPAVMSSGEWTKPMTVHVTPGLEAKAFAVTEEPEGGMPQPTGPKVLVGVGE